MYSAQRRQSKGRSPEDTEVTVIERPVLLNYAGALLAGAAYPLAFAPFGVWPVALGSIATLLFCLNRTVLVHTFGILLFFGIGKYAIGTSWIYEGLITLGNIKPSLATGLVSAFVLFYSLFFAIALTVVKFWVGLTAPQFRRSRHLAIRSLPFCAGWLLFEQANYLTALDTSFPWLDLGYAFTDTWLAGLAPIGGITLVSATAVAGVVGLLMLASMPRVSLLVIGAPWIAGALLLQQEWTQAERELDVALVQADVSIAEKFAEDGLDLAWETHVDLSLQAQDADIV
ncbi:MAG: hypothetical protein OXG24_09935, partial [Gammaproteobacteria bacterium]|nr:hypothetical protein [Gammaproteobacteria bacterium]